MTSRCSATTCHSPSGESTPPGKRQPMPTTAIGSLVPSSSSRTRWRDSWRSTVRRLR
ncbi:hypothetical protein [Streptomyces sp. AGS-58]|uniref:hypothetical protein n=1 Tax=unclassified Streptomyces TaxID=2593676 RepID=UPI0035A39DB8